MNDLKKMGVQELNFDEQKNLDGGFPIIGWFIAAGIVWAAANFVKDVIIEGTDYDCTSW